MIDNNIMKKYNYDVGVISKYQSKLKWNELRYNYLMFEPRDEVESNPEFKQVIPYIVFRVRKSNGDVLYPWFRRLSGDKRLINKFTIGVGGHIERKDTLFSTVHNIENIIKTTIIRELNEELKITDDLMKHIKSIKFDGMINMDNTEVNLVHSGVVISVELSDTIAFESNNEELQYMGTYQIGEYLLEHVNLEDWSRWYLENIDKAQYKSNKEKTRSY